MGNVFTRVRDIIGICIQDFAGQKSSVFRNFLTASPRLNPGYGKMVELKYKNKFVFFQTRLFVYLITPVLIYCYTAHGDENP